MKAVFKDRINAGKINVPEHLTHSFDGVVTITLESSEANETTKDAEAVNWFQSILGKVEPFTPLTREEANDRYLK